jgi:hypothetical protein
LQNVGQDLLVLDFFVGGDRAGGKGVCGRLMSQQLYVLLSVALKISGFLLLPQFAPSIKLTAKI